MSSLCQQIKTEYDQLQMLRERFFLAYEKSQVGGDRVLAKSLKLELEVAFIEFEQKITPFISEERIIDEIEKFISKCVDEERFAWELADVLVGLVGLDSDRAWEIREQALKTPNPGFLLNNVVQSLVGIDSDRAWQIRNKVYEKIKNEGIHSPSIVPFLIGLGGLDSDRAWQMRDATINIDPGSIYAGDDNRLLLFASMDGIDSERAWQIREQCFEEAKSSVNITIATNIAGSMNGIDSEKAWQMRDKLLKYYARNQGVYSNIAKSLVGLDSERAWQMRDKILQQEPMCFFSIVGGLSGVDSERAWQMREELFERIIQRLNRFHITDLAYSLSWLNSPRAWQMRERMAEQGASEKDILISIAGNHVNWFKRDDA
jgi:hypothetical protein